ncbi:MAG TPA: hypothetical protein VML75_03090 [Kofleriaceae bacterium]|nr:hypothetical protein [Kofleriaceae bacterium]
MAKDCEQVAESIRILSHPSGGFVIRIGEAAMLGLMPVFEQEGAYSNGPAWGALLEARRPWAAAAAGVSLWQ